MEEFHGNNNVSIGPTLLGTVAWVLILTSPIWITLLLLLNEKLAF